MRTATARTIRMWRHADLVLLALIFMAALAVLARDGILFSHATYSDETQHLHRAMIAARLWRGEFSLDLMATLYGGGIWPPLYPMLMGGLEAAFQLGVTGLRLVNVAVVFVGFAFFMRMTADPRLRLLSLVLPACFLAGTSTVFQIRPENLAILLTGALCCLIARRGLFPGRSVEDGPARDYVLLGVLAGLTCLTHAVFALGTAYLALLALTSLRRRWTFVAAILAVAGPYFVLQNAMHTGLVLFATTAEENLARNNNPFLTAVPRPEADDLLFAEMDRRYAEGDQVAYRKPLVVPANRYAQWLHDENKRRIFKEIALAEIAHRPAEALRRVGDRIVALLTGDVCLDDGRYGCVVSATVDRAAYALFVALGLAGLLAAARAEWRTGFAISFCLLCGILLVPMVMTQALVRHFAIVLLVGAYGGLFRLGAAPRNRRVDLALDGTQPA